MQFRRASGLVGSIATALVALHAGAHAHAQDAHPHALGATANARRSLRSSDAGDATASGSTIVLEQRPLALETASDALREAPGARPQALGGFGSFSGVSLRGAEIAHTSVLIGNLPLDQLDEGAFDLSLLPIAFFEHVNVYRGGAPAWLSEGSIGGVVQLTPRVPTAQRMHASAGAGSFGRKHAALGTELAPDANRGPFLQAHVAVDHADNDFPYVDPGSPLVRGDERERRTRNAQVTQGAALALARTPLWGGELEWLAIGMSRSAGIPGPQRAPSLSAHRQLVRAASALGFTRSGELASGHAYRVQALLGGGHQANRVSDHGEIGTTFFAETDDRWNTAYARAAGSLAITSALELTAIAHARYDELRPDNPLAFRAPPRPSQRMSEIGILEARLHGPLLGMESELRGSARLHFSQASIRATRSEDAEPREVASLAPTYRLASAVKLYDNLVLSASLASGQRLPTFGELFGDRAFLQPNPELDPERSIGGDAGVRVHGSAGMLCFSTELRAFFLTIADSIIYVRSARFDARPENLSEVAIRGAELAQRVSYGEHVAWTTSATAMNSRTSLGHQAPNRPQLVLYTRPELMFAFDGALSRVTVFGDLQVVSFNYTDKANLHAIPGRQWLGVGGALGLWDDRIELQLRASNVLDQPAEDLSGFALPRRALFASLTFEETL